MIREALIYCRVSTTRQVHDGHGLDSQLQRCEEYARSKGYRVARRFFDEGVSGGLFERPAMQELIAYLDSRPTEDFAIIFDDLSRFARDVTVHLKMKTELESRGARLECLNYNFDNSPEGEFIEVVLAGKAQLDRQQNKRQVCQKMKARLERGYWCFHQPTGYEFYSDPSHGKLLRPKEPEAAIIREALEGFARGILLTQRDVQDFINAKNYKGVGNIHLEGVKRILTQPLYAGLIDYPPWRVKRMQGHHEPLISMETFERVELRLQEKVQHRVRIDDRAEFPLRRFILCEECGIGLTASWSRGRNKQKYPYYHCKTRACKLNVAAQKLEEAFSSTLQEVKPTEGILKLFSHILSEEFKQRLTIDVGNVKEREQKINTLKASIQELAELALKSRSDDVREVYEIQMEQKIQEVKALQDSTTQVIPARDFGNTLQKGEAILKNPLETWQSGSLKDRQMIQTIVFRQGPSFSRTNGCGNIKYSLLYRVLMKSTSDKSSLVEMPGFEPGYNNENQLPLQP